MYLKLLFSYIKLKRSVSLAETAHIFSIIPAGLALLAQQREAGRGGGAAGRGGPGEAGGRGGPEAGGAPARARGGGGPRPGGGGAGAGGARARPAAEPAGAHGEEEGDVDRRKDVQWELG